jgi:CHAT domain-containing protein
MLHQQPEKAVKFATAALPQLKLEENDRSRLWDGQIVCTLANALLVEKNIAEATRRANTCLQVAKKINDPQLLAFAHQTNVWVSEAAGKPTEALASLLFLTAKEATPSLYIQRASLEAQQGNDDAAITAWKQALHLFEIQKDLKGMASTNLSLAIALLSEHSSSGADAKLHALAALALYNQLNDLEGQARANLVLANYSAKSQDNIKALAYFSTALNGSRVAKQSGLEAYILAEIGRAYASSPTPLAALDYFHKSIDVYISLHDTGNQALVLKDEAEVLARQHKIEEALTIALTAQKVADTSGLWFPRFWTRWLLAMLYGNEGEYGKSITTLREAESISDEAHQPHDSALAALDLSEWLITIGNWEEALNTINRALPVFKTFKDTDNELSAYNTLTEIFGGRESELKDLDKALEYYGLARQLVGTSDPGKSADLSQEICEIYWQQGRFKESIQEASTALAYYRSSNNEWGQASSLITLAEAQRSVGDITAATESLSQAVPIVKQVNNFYMTGRLYYGQANLMKKEHKYKEAISKYTNVIDLLEQFKFGVDSDLQRKVSENYGFIYDELLDCYYQLSIADTQNQTSSADDALRYSELNKSRVFTTTWGRTFLTALRRGLPAELQEQERSLALRQSSLQTDSVDGVAGKASHLGGQGQTKETLGNLALEQAALKKAILEADPAYSEARYPNPISIASLPLRDGETFVEFKMLQDGLLVWIVEGTANAPRLLAFYRVDHPRAWFEDRILAIRSAFNLGHPDGFDAKGSEELFQAIFPEPIATKVSVAPSIIFVPDDILFLLPMEILSPHATASQFTFLKTSTTYFPSAAAFTLARAIEPSRAEWRKQFVGIADPITSKNDPRFGAVTLLSTITAEESHPEVGNSKMSTRSESADLPYSETPSMDGLNTRGYFFNRLPETSTEVGSIAALFPPAPATLVRTGLDATKSKLLQTDLGSFRFIHFATHGFVPVEPGVMEPALILSYDGGDDQKMMLSLTDILQLKLHAEMVVLSACNTGSGKVTRAEGVASLGAAFLTAGASSTVMSLWKVSDLSTSLLMQEFYRNLLKGMPKNSALAAARSALVSKGYSNPFFWAPFVLTGE